MRRRDRKQKANKGADVEASSVDVNVCDEISPRTMASDAARLWGSPTEIEVAIDAAIVKEEVSTLTSLQQKRFWSPTKGNRGSDDDDDDALWGPPLDLTDDGIRATASGAGPLLTDALHKAARDRAMADEKLAELHRLREAAHDDELALIKMHAKVVADTARMHAKLKADAGKLEEEAHNGDEPDLTLWLAKAMSPNKRRARCTITSGAGETPKGQSPAGDGSNGKNKDETPWLLKAARLSRSLSLSNDSEDTPDATSPKPQAEPTSPTKAEATTPPELDPLTAQLHLASKYEVELPPPPPLPSVETLIWDDMGAGAGRKSRLQRAREEKERRSGEMSLLVKSPERVNKKLDLEDLANMEVWSGHFRYT